MAKLKNRIIHLFTSHWGRLQILAVMIAVGGILGTDGLLEIESQEDFWNWVMYIGIAGMLIYFVYGMYYAIKNLISDIKDR